jgi:hypothetical protein
MPALKTSRRQWEIWRFQRDRLYPDVVTGLTKDRKRWVFVTLASDPKQHALWVKRFGERETLYAKAIVGSSTHKPQVKVLQFVEDW